MQDCGSKICKLYESLNRKDIIIIDTPFFEEKKAISFFNNNIFWIGINLKKIESDREELCILAEEKAHYDVGIIPHDYTSNSYCDRITREKNELRAKKSAIKNLIPKDELFKIIKKEPYLDIYELAEHFDVTTSFMQEALIIYGLI